MQDASLLDLVRDLLPRRPSGDDLRGVFDGIFSRSDPWSYGDGYEVTKRAHVLESLPDGQGARALEVGCAEGHLTAELAPRVGSLVALDLSEHALARARDRCSGLTNVEFVRGDAFGSLPPGPFDLIVCSEVLYYVGDRFALAALCRRLAAALAPGGHLVLAHANLVADDPDATGFDFHSIGSAFIASTFAACGRLDFRRELRTDLYRIQLFRHRPTGTPRRMAPVEVITRSACLAPGDKAARIVKWGGCVATEAESRWLWRSPAIPVLMYHRISDDGPDALAPYRVGAKHFERQLAYLQRQGYRSVEVERAYGLLRAPDSPPAGKLVAITFDDAYLDFHETALPLLERYGFSATLFVPLGHVGGAAEWDADCGPPARLMNWDQILDASRRGTRIGSHGLSHQRLPGAAAEFVGRELAGSKAMLEDRLGAEVAGFSYPFGVQDGAVIEQVRQCGYRFAVAGCGLLGPNANPFSLPRQEILGSDTIEDFVAKLGECRPSPWPVRLRYRLLRWKRDRRLYMSI